MKIFYQNRISLCLFVAISSILCGCSTSSYWNHIDADGLRIWPLSIYCDGGQDDEISMAHNTASLIYQELNDPALITRFVLFLGLDKNEAANYKLVPNGPNNEFLMHYGGTNYSAIFECAMRYVHERKRGHTRDFLNDAFSNSFNWTPNRIEDKQDILCLPIVPASWMKHEGDLVLTNEDQSISKRVFYSIVDGEIKWSYSVGYGMGTNPVHVTEFKIDAKESNPEFQSIFDEVDKEVEKEMKTHFSHGKLGECHYAWALKKKKLKERGVEWRSIAELNPNINMD